MLLTRMPGHSYRGALPTISQQESMVERLLRNHIEVLANKIVDRNVFNIAKMMQAVEYLESELKAAGHQPKRHNFNSWGQTVCNIDVHIPGSVRKNEVLVVGAHYDSLNGSPGANDNASGTAAILVLAKLLSEKSLGRSVRLVLFANEEAPFFQTPEMGSWSYAKKCKAENEKQRIKGMICLETIGYYTNVENSQSYPFPLSLFYPSQGNFIAFVGNRDSASLVRETVAAFRKHTKFPSEGAALHTSFKRISDSDHWSFWKEGFKALMVTDTAPFRYPYYHTPQDTVEKIDYEATARVVVGLSKTIEELAAVESTTTPEPALAGK